MTPASEKRIQRFFDNFIRSDYVANWTAEKDSDFFNEPDRAERVADASESGAYGATHAEIIEDWREAFSAWLRDHRRGTLDRFENAVNARIDACESWHEKNGSLDQEIG